MTNDDQLTIILAQAYAQSYLEKSAEFDWKQLQPYLPYLGAAAGGLGGYALGGKNPLMTALFGALAGGFGSKMGADYAFDNKNPLQSLQGMWDYTSKNVKDRWNRGERQEQESQAAQDRLVNREISQGETPAGLGLRDLDTGEAPTFKPWQETQTGGQDYYAGPQGKRLYRSPSPLGVPDFRDPRQQFTERPGAGPYDTHWGGGGPMSPHIPQAVLEAREGMKTPILKNSAYWQGFYEKCAEMNIDPEDAIRTTISHDDGMKTPSDPGGTFAGGGSTPASESLPAVWDNRLSGPAAYAADRDPSIQGEAPEETGTTKLAANSMQPGNQMKFHHPGSSSGSMKMPQFNSVQTPNTNPGPQLNSLQGPSLPNTGGGVHAQAQGLQTNGPNVVAPQQQQGGLPQQQGQPPMGQPGSSNTSPQVAPTVPRPYGPPTEQQAQFTQQQGVPYGSY